MNEFDVPYYHGKDKEDPKPVAPRKTYEPRGNRGMAVIELFTTDFTKTGTGYTNRSGNYKPFGGGTDPIDLPENDENVTNEEDKAARALNPYEGEFAAAYNTAARELREESHVNVVEELQRFTLEDGKETPLVFVEDHYEYIRNDASFGRRHYFVGVMQKDRQLERFDVIEDGVDKHFNKQGWTTVEEMLDGGYQEPFNTLYCASLPLVLLKMMGMKCFAENPAFQELLARIAPDGNIAEVLAEKRKKIATKDAEKKALGESR